MTSYLSNGIQGLTGEHKGWVNASVTTCAHRRYIGKFHLAGLSPLINDNQPKDY